MDNDSQFENHCSKTKKIMSSYQKHKYKNFPYINNGLVPSMK